MKKIITLLMCVALSVSLLGCSTEPDHELWQQFKATDDHASLFTDFSTEKTILLDNEHYTLTLYEQSTEDIEGSNDKYDGFLIGVKIKNNSASDAIFSFTDIKVNDVELPEPEKIPLGGMAHSQNEYMAGIIYVDYEGLARCNITTVEEVSFVMEVNEMIEDVKEETDENGNTINVHHLEKGKLLYTSDEITFKCITE